MYLYLIRHALPDYQSPIDYHTPPGPGLTAEGHAQAAALAEWLRPVGIQRLLVSPLRRCRETAAPLAAALGLAPVIDDDVREQVPGEPATEVRVRMLRAALTLSDVRIAVIVSHAAPLTELLLTLARDESLLPPPDHRGNRLRECEIWTAANLDGRWRIACLSQARMVC